LAAALQEPNGSVKQRPAALRHKKYKRKSKLLALADYALPCDTALAMPQIFLPTQIVMVKPLFMGFQFSLGVDNGLS